MSSHLIQRRDHAFDYMPCFFSEAVRMWPFHVAVVSIVVPSFQNWVRRTDRFSISATLQSCVIWFHSFIFRKLTWFSMRWRRSIQLINEQFEHLIPISLSKFLVAAVPSASEEVLLDGSERYKRQLLRLEEFKAALNAHAVGPSDGHCDRYSTG